MSCAVLNRCFLSFLYTHGMNNKCHNRCVTLIGSHCRTLCAPDKGYSSPSIPYPVSRYPAYNPLSRILYPIIPYPVSQYPVSRIPYPIIPYPRIPLSSYPVSISQYPVSRIPLFHFPYAARVARGKRIGLVGLGLILCGISLYPCIPYPAYPGIPYIYIYIYPVSRYPVSRGIPMPLSRIPLSRIPLSLARGQTLAACACLMPLSRMTYA